VTPQLRHKRADITIQWYRRSKGPGIEPYKERCDSLDANHFPQVVTLPFSLELPPQCLCHSSHNAPSPFSDAARAEAEAARAALQVQPAAREAGQGVDHLDVRVAELPMCPFPISPLVNRARQRTAVAAGRPQPFRLVSRSQAFPPEVGHGKVSLGAGRWPSVCAMRGTRGANG